MRKAIKNKTWFSSRYLWLLIWRLAGILFDGTCFTVPSSLSCIMMTHAHLMKFLKYTPFLSPLWCIQNSYTVRNSVRYTQNAHAKKNMNVKRMASLLCLSTTFQVRFHSLSLWRFFVSIIYGIDFKTRFSTRMTALLII